MGDPLTVRAYSFRLIDSKNPYYSTTTTCRWVGEHCTIFVEDEEWGTPRISLAGIESVARAFDLSTARYADRGIFSVETALFGPPPDADGDPRISIVILDILDSPITGSTYVGYFDTENQNPPISREIIYLDSNPLDIDSDLARATLAHEFQHMLHWRADPDEEKWLDEGCSEYAELACGYKDTTEAALWAYLQINTYTGLTEWDDEAYDFDQAFLWTAYFAERYGESALQHLVSDPENGISSVNRVLESLAVSERFEGLFADWVAAIYLDGSGILGYRGLSLGPVKRDTVAASAHHARKAPLWGADYLDIEADGGFSLEVEGDGENGLVAVLMDPDGSPSATSYFIPPGARQRIGSYGSGRRALAIGRTSGETEGYAFTISEMGGRTPAASDFDASGRVGFEDFLQFAVHFGRAAGQEGYDPTYDLDANRRVGFSDFLIFARNFGTTL